MFSSYSLGPTRSTSESPFKRMLVSLSPFYKGNSDDELSCPKPHSRLIAKIKWHYVCLDQQMLCPLGHRLQREIRQAFLIKGLEKNKVKYCNWGGRKTILMDKTEDYPCMKFCWHYMHNTFEKKPGNMPEHNIALHSHGVFHLRGTGYPFQVWNYFQLASRQVAVLQAQVILHSPDAARLKFFTLSAVINSSCLHGFSLSAQKSLWKILVKVTGSWKMRSLWVWDTCPNPLSSTKFLKMLLLTPFSETKRKLPGK